MAIKYNIKPTTVNLSINKLEDLTGNIQNQKRYNVIDNGEYEITPDKGYDCMKSVYLTVNLSNRLNITDKFVSAAYIKNFNTSELNDWENLIDGSYKCEFTQFATGDMNLSKLTYATAMFSNSTGVTLSFTPESFKELENSTVMFVNCKNVDQFTFNMPNLRIAEQMFKDSTISHFNSDTVLLDNALGMFNNCLDLTSIKINISNCSTEDTVDSVKIFGCPNLIHLDFYGTIKNSLNLKNTKLDKQSILNVIDHLVDLTGQTTKTLWLPNVLSEDELIIATNKNWSIQ